MPRFWDADSGQWIDADSPTFTGPQATHTIVDGSAYHIRGHILTDGAMAAGATNHKRYKTRGTGPDGLNVRAPQRERRKQPREGRAA